MIAPPRSRSVVEVLIRSGESLTGGGQARGVATFLFSPVTADVEIIFRRELSLDLCGVLGGPAGGGFLSWARRTPRSHILRRGGLADRAPELHEGLRKEKLGGVALFPILGEDSVLGYSVVGLPTGEREASEVAAVAALEWQRASGWIETLRVEAGRSTLRSLLSLHQEGLARGVQGLVIVDWEDRIAFSHGIPRILPSWGRGEVTGQLLKGLPGGRVLASMEPAGSGHLDWRTRKVRAGEVDFSLEMAAYTVVPDWEGRGQWRGILVREGASNAQETHGGILLELALRLAKRDGTAPGLSSPELEGLARNALAVAEKAEVEESIDLTGLFRGFLHRLEPSLKDDRIQVLPFLQGELPRVRGNRGQLEAALWAILQKSWNSLLPRGGTITLRTWEEEGSVWCTIADDGEGTDDWSALETLALEPVTLEDDTTPLPAQGIDLARELVRNGGGTFHVETRPRLWTRYAVVFPAERVVRSTDGSAATGIPPAVEVRRSGKGPLEVLVVDDNEMVRTVLRKFLERKGHEVTEAVDGSVALQILHEREFDRVMVDIDMPGTTGVEFFQRLDSVNPAMRDRTVFMTGGFQEGDTEDFIHETGRPHIQKPFDLKLISDVLQA